MTDEQRIARLSTHWSALELGARLDEQFGAPSPLSALVGLVNNTVRLTDWPAEVFDQVEPRDRPTVAWALRTSAWLLDAAAARLHTEEEV